MAEAYDIALLNAEDDSPDTFDSTTAEVGNSISAVAGAELHGSKGFDCSFGGSNNDAYGDFAFTEDNDVWIRFYIRIPTGYSDNNGALAFLYLYDGTGFCAAMRAYRGVGESIIYPYQFYYYTNTTEYNLASISGVSWNIGDDQHYVDIRYKSGSGDGAAECWIDNVQKANIASLTNNNRAANKVRAGQAGPGIPTSGSHIHIDDIKINNATSGRPGAYFDEATTPAGLIIPGKCLHSLTQGRIIH